MGPSAFRIVLRGRGRRNDRPGSYQQRQAVEWRGDGDPLGARMDLVRPEVVPAALWQIGGPVRRARTGDRRDQQIVAPEILASELPHVWIIGIVQDKRPHQW